MDKKEQIAKEKLAAGFLATKYDVSVAAAWHDWQNGHVAKDDHDAALVFADDLLKLFEPEKAEQMWRCQDWETCKLPCSSGSKEPHPHDEYCGYTSSLCPTCQPIPPTRKEQVEKLAKDNQKSEWCKNADSCSGCNEQERRECAECGGTGLVSYSGRAPDGPDRCEKCNPEPAKTISTLDGFMPHPNYECGDDGCWCKDIDSLDKYISNHSEPASEPDSEGITRIGYEARIQGYQDTIKEMAKDKAEIDRAIADARSCYEREQKAEAEVDRLTHELLRINDDDQTIIENLQAKLDELEAALDPKAFYIAWQVAEYKVEELEAEYVGLESMTDGFIEQVKEGNKRQSEYLKLIEQLEAENKALKKKQLTLEEYDHLKGDTSDGQEPYYLRDWLKDCPICKSIDAKLKGG